MAGSDSDALSFAAKTPVRAAETMKALHGTDIVFGHGLPA
jgi:hypothetical protein